MPPLLPDLSPARALATATAAATWSHSQQRTLDGCARARFWASEVAPDGWRPEAMEVARVARRLKTLTTLDMELGRALHARAAERARALRDREVPPPLVVMRQRTTAHLNYVWAAARSRRADWERDPKRVPMLLDAYYGRGPTREQAAAVRERMEQGLLALHGLGLWAELGACHPADVLVVDSLTSYELPDSDGGPAVVVWAAPDLVMRVELGGRWEVIDVKSSRLRDGRAYADGVRQVQSYSAFLRHGVRVLGPDEGCRGRLVSLGDASEFEFEISPADIDAAEARIRAGAQRMAELRAAADMAATEAVAAGMPRSSADVAAIVHAARRSAYKMTTDRARCRRCPYLELCLPELEVLDREAVAGGQEDDVVNNAAGDAVCTPVLAEVG